MGSVVFDGGTESSVLAGSQGKLWDIFTGLIGARIRTTRWQQACRGRKGIIRVVRGCDVETARVFTYGDSLGTPSYESICLARYSLKLNAIFKLIGATRTEAIRAIIRYIKSI